MVCKKGRFAFRDRPLKKGEKHHWYCIRCGADVHPDLMLQHRCNLKLKKKVSRYGMNGSGSAGTDRSGICFST